MTRSLGALAAIVLAVAAWSALTYNHLVQSRLAVDAQWAQVEAQYQRRVDLIPNLVAAVEGVLQQERMVFRALALARTAYLSAPPGSPQRVRAANDLERPLGHLIGVVEAYPQLRSADTIARLMDELTGTENRIAVERRRYNERVRIYDTLVQQFPNSLIAAAAHFEPRPYFTAAPPAGAAPAITLPPR
jgi:LemA protein